MSQFSMIERKNLRMKNTILSEMQFGVHSVEINVAVLRRYPDLWAFAFFGDYKTGTNKNGNRGYFIKVKKSNKTRKDCFGPYEQDCYPSESRFWSYLRANKFFVSADEFEITKQIVEREPISKKQQFANWYLR